MTDQEKITLFTKTLRRCLYLSKIYEDSLTWLKMDSLTTSGIKNDINNIHNSMKRMLNNMMCNASRETWDKIRVDLSSDQLQDLSLLIDSVMGVNKIAEITEVIEIWKRDLFGKDAA